MSRRLSLAGLILVFLIWSAVLLSPNLRILLLAQATPEWPKFLQKIGLRDDWRDRVLREHPNDPRVLAFQAGFITNYKPGEDYRKGELVEYDRLIERFPKEEWLLLNRLRLSTSGGGFTMNTGELGATGSGTREPWLTKPEMLQALKIAEKGAKHYPQNSFYDWMRAIFLFTLKRNEGGLRALEEGSRKSSFDDGVLVDGQNRVYVRGLESPLLWEDRVSISASTLLPQYVFMREASRAAVWRGVLAERKGDHKRALEIYGNQIRLAGPLRRDAKLFIGTLVGEAIERIAWTGMTRKSVPNQTSDPSVRAKEAVELATRFADYASRHGRKDLAAQALEDVRQFRGGKMGNFFGELEFGVPTEGIRSIAILHWTDAMLLRALTLSTLLWLISSALIWGMKLRNIQQEINVTPQVSILDTATSGLFVVVAFVIVWIATLQSDVRWTDLMFIGSQGGFFSESDNAIKNIASRVLVWMPVALTIPYCLIVMLWRARKSRRVPHSQPEVDSMGERSVVMQIQNGLRWASLRLAIVALCYVFVWWISTLFYFSSVNINTQMQFMIFGPLLLLSVIYYLSRQHSKRIIDWAYMLAWCRSTIGALFVLGSVAYFVCALLVLPLRRDADKTMDKYMVKGEVAMIEEFYGR